MPVGPWLPMSAPEAAHSASPQQHRVPSAAAHSVFCECPGQGGNDRSCKELVSIFSRQSQRLWKVVGRLRWERMMKGND